MQHARIDSHFDRLLSALNELARADSEHRIVAQAADAAVAMFGAASAAVVMQQPAETFAHASPAATADLRAAVDARAAADLRAPGSIDVAAQPGGDAFVSVAFGERGRSAGYLGLMLKARGLARLGDDDRRILGTLAIATGAALDRVRCAADLLRRSERDGYLAKLDAMLGTVGQTEMLDSVLALQRVTLEVPGLTFDEFYEPGPHAPYIGGDWYDAFRVRDGRVVLSIGDVPGTGLRAASTMASVRQVIRGVASVNPEPRVILEAVERILEGGASHDAPFVTAWVGVLDPVDLTLTYASAGHPAPLWRDRSGVVRTLPNGDPPLGIGLRTLRSLHAVRLESGSALLLYTDGLIETRQDSLDDGIERVRTALTRHRALPPDGLLDELLAEVHAETRTDDIAVLLVRIDGPVDR